MSADNDYERIAVKAHEIWESEGRPHGRDQSHWDQAKEIVALHDSMGDTLLPRDSGSFEPEEPTQSTEAYGDMPGLTDQGRDDLVDTDREPEVTKPAHAIHALGDTAGHVARSVRDETADIDDGETVTPAPKVAAVTPTPSNPTLGEPAPRAAAAEVSREGPQDIAAKSGGAEPEPSAAVPGSGLNRAPFGTGAGMSPSGARAPAGTAAPSGLGSTGAPPLATPAGAAPAAPDDARLGSSLQAPPSGNSAPVTAKSPPKPAPQPEPVTRGKPPQGRR